MRHAHPTCLILAVAVVLPAHATPPPLPTRVTILYDAFGGRAGLTRDWGFAALVEYNGKRILFDTGNNADLFAKNVRALGIDLRTVDFVVVDSVTEVAPGVSIFPTVSQKPGTLELRELSLALRTPSGLILLVGCSHPGIETIVDASTRVADHVYLILGGLHLVITPDAEIERVATALHDHWHVDRIGPGHCTGEPAFATLQRVFAAQYVYAGLGSTIDMP